MNPTSPLLTDLYQLTMLAAYFDRGMNETAVFEYFVRELPVRRGFLVAAGLDQALDFLENLRFGEEDLRWLRDCGRFRAEFVNALERLRFTGEVWAPREGTVMFANEPILQVVAPLQEAQLVETRLINILHFQTMIASKAVRCVLASPEKPLIDFGLRRAHGSEAGLMAARAAYLAGFAGTSAVLAQPAFGIPVFGTMAHSFVQAHADEEEAFVGFARSHPGNVVLLIDTYDTEEGARAAVRAARRLAAEGIDVRAVRIDSGDLAEAARRVRRILDDAGLTGVEIFASGNLDEDRLARLTAGGAPIDGFGVGTRLDTSADAPYLESAYKLVEYAGRPVFKNSEGKAVYPGRKQVWRRVSEGRFAGDTIAGFDESPDGRPLLSRVMAGGRRTGPRWTVDDGRRWVREQLDQLPETVRGLDPPYRYDVEISPGLKELAAELGAAAG